MSNEPTPSIRSRLKNWIATIPIETKRLSYFWGAFLLAIVISAWTHCPLPLYIGWPIALVCFWLNQRHANVVGIILGDLVCIASFVSKLWTPNLTLPGMVVGMIIIIVFDTKRRKK